MWHYLTAVDQHEVVWLMTLSNDLQRSHGRHCLVPALPAGTKEPCDCYSTLISFACCLRSTRGVEPRFVKILLGNISLGPSCHTASIGWIFESVSWGSRVTWGSRVKGCDNILGVGGAATHNCGEVTWYKERCPQNNLTKYIKGCTSACTVRGEAKMTKHKTQAQVY